MGDFLMNKECLNTIESLRSNNSILITKHDKRSGVVILNKNDYISKIEAILYDLTKFKTLCSSTKNDNAAKIESRIERRLLQLSKDNLLPPECTKLSDPHAPYAHACTACRKHTRKAFHYDQSLL